MYLQTDRDDALPPPDAPVSGAETAFSLLASGRLGRLVLAAAEVAAAAHAATEDRP